jgi:hypothetical protein
MSQRRQGGAGRHHPGENQDRAPTRLVTALPSGTAVRCDAKAFHSLDCRVSQPMPRVMPLDNILWAVKIASRARLESKMATEMYLASDLIRTFYKQVVIPN